MHIKTQLKRTQNEIVFVKQAVRIKLHFLRYKNLFLSQIHQLCIFLTPWNDQNPQKTINFLMKKPLLHKTILIKTTEDYIKHEMQKKDSVNWSKKQTCNRWVMIWRESINQLHYYSRWNLFLAPLSLSFLILNRLVDKSVV